MKLPYKKPKVRSGDLKTVVTFYKIKRDSFEPNDSTEEQLFECFAQVYGPSQKDLTILTTNDAKEGVTIKIRNTKGEFIPDNTMVVTIDDYRYLGKIWNVKDVRPDFETDKFDIIVLGDPT